MPENHRHNPGQSVVLRDTGHFVGEVWGLPFVVVEDTEELVALYRPEGTRWLAWSIDEQSFRTLPFCRMDMLRLMYPSRNYSVEMYFDTGAGPAYPMFEGEGRFRGWKVNIEAPFRRTAIGFDTTDEFLDIFVMPDRSLYWAYGDHMDFWVDAGGYDLSDRARLLAAGFEAESAIRDKRPPFDDTWTSWKPEDIASDLDLPDGWETLPGSHISLGNQTRYNAWKMGKKPERVLEEWRTLTASQRREPALRRFDPHAQRTGRASSTPTAHRGGPE